MTKLGEFLFGLALTILGAFLFLSNVTVYGFYTGFFSMTGGSFHTGSSTCAMIVLIMCITLFVAVWKPNFLANVLLFIEFILFIVAIIFSLNFGFRHMSGFTFFGILAIFVIGLALVFRGMTGVPKAEDTEDKIKKYLGDDK